MNRFVLALCLFVGADGLIPALAQEPCRAPAPPVSREPNIFTGPQESDLGDAMAESVEPFLRVIEDEALTAELRRIGERLVNHLPPTGLRIQFKLIDVPWVNAYALPGGRIYVTRKLIGFTRDEDELAGVLGHELGHLVARQQTIDMTRKLRELIGVTEVGDRQDIFEKYNRMTDNEARKPGLDRTADHANRDQIEADRLGLFVVAAAGYDPQAHVRLFDRFVETGGNTGSFLSKMFGTTNPDAKRLGEMIRNTTALPAGCAEARAPGDAARYVAWKASVASFRGLARKESLHGVLARTKLEPALRGEVTHLRFAPDGRYVMAQDASGIAVLSREPFSLVFRIDAPEAEPAQFTPDSRDVVFHTDGLRIERWRVADRKLVEAHDLVLRKTCLNSALSPDGRTLACHDTDFNLLLIDVASSAPVFQRKSFYPGNSLTLLSSLLGLALGRSGGASLRFSPDARYFAASGYKDLDSEVVVLYDLQTRAAITLKNPAKKLVTSEFTFTAPDRLVGLNPDDPAKSGVIRLPEGDVVDQFMLPRTSALDAPTRGNYLLLRPFQKYAVALLDLSKKTVVKGNAMAAFDLHDDVFVAERGTGDLGLYATDGNRVIQAVTLPPGPLGRVRAAAVSADFQWLAVSERSRGAIWDVGRQQRLTQTRGFAGAYFDDGGVLFADLSKAGADPRAIMRLDLAQKFVSNSGEVKDRYAQQVGPWMVVTKPLPPGANYVLGAEYEIRDVRRPAPLWTKSFPRNPPDAWSHEGSDSIVFSWDAASPTGREVIRKDPALRASVNLGDIAGDLVLEIVSTETGQLRRRMLLETGKGSFRVREVLTTGDWMAVSDIGGRVLMYSLATGELHGHAFGAEPAISPAAGLVAVDGGGGRLVLYDLATMRRRDEFTFTSDIPLKTFSPDGKRLFVLTSDQTAFVLNVSK